MQAAPLLGIARIIEQGRTDAVDTTSLHVPSIDLVVGGDVF
jgi:hypothetical protein